MKEFSFSPHFQAEIIILALRIAKHQRGEERLQDVDILREKFKAEEKELFESEYPPEEITDVLYYAVQLAAKSQPDYLRIAQEEILPKYPYNQAQIEAATLAKFKLRAAGANTKDKATERQAVMIAMGG